MKVGDVYSSRQPSRVAVPHPVLPPVVESGGKKTHGRCAAASLKLRAKRRFRVQVERQFCLQPRAPVLAATLLREERLFSICLRLTCLCGLETGVLGALRRRVGSGSFKMTA
jgi:hypothetical protein